MPPNPQVGDLVSTRGQDLGIVIQCKPQQVVGASWVPERCVVWWLASDKRTTEFVGDAADIMEIISAAFEAKIEKEN